MLISIVGTLITDNLTDNFGVSLVTTTIVFAVLLAATFAVWYASERTLSIHTIVTTRREAFYWLAVLFTFALGTAAGDLTAERLAIGYWQSALLFGALIAAVYVAHVRFALNAILAFWIAYILTRPLGASIGDYLSQPRADGGLGLGTTVTSVVFLLTILAVVVFLTITKRDTIESEPARAGHRRSRSGSHPGRRQQDARDPGARRGRAPARCGRPRRVRRARSQSRAPGIRPHRARPPTRVRRCWLARRYRHSRKPSGVEVQGRVASSPNAFDDIVAELGRRSYSEIILETLPAHVSHWLHLDLSQRLAHLGYPLTTVTATH